jgi:hypothetical protein
MKRKKEPWTIAKLIDVFIWILVIMLVLILGIAISRADEPLAATALGEQPTVSGYSQGQNELDRYLDWWLRHYPYRRMKAQIYSQMAVKWAGVYRIDPLLVGIIISLESSWIPSAIGSKTEQGLMQVHPSNARDLDLRHPDDQIQAGCRLLRKCFDRCKGHTLRALNCYGTKGGKCRPALSFAKRRLRIYKRAISQFRSKN